MVCLQTCAIAVRVTIQLLVWKDHAPLVGSFPKWEDPMKWKRFKVAILYVGAGAMVVQAGRHLAGGVTDLDNVAPALFALGIAYYLARRARSCAG